MNLITKTNGNTRVIIIHGDVDLYNAQELRDIIHNQVDSGIKSLILSFKNVSYIDSSGIGSLLHIIRTAWALKIRIAFADLTEPVMNLIELTKLRSFFPIAESMDDALTMVLSGEEK